MSNRNTINALIIGTCLFFAAAIAGQIQSVVKCIASDWKPSYKREVIYGVSALTGFGCIVGWLNIPDEPVDYTNK